MRKPLSGWAQGSNPEGREHGKTQKAASGYQ